ncbi:hypothetical protein BCR34DRAFT_552094, partial [Clohesyomyces aquaticus]
MSGCASCGVWIHHLPLLLAIIASSQTGPFVFAELIIIPTASTGVAGRLQPYNIHTDSKREVNGISLRIFTSPSSNPAKTDPDAQLSVSDTISYSDTDPWTRAFIQGIATRPHRTDPITRRKPETCKMH